MRSRLETAALLAMVAGMGLGGSTPGSFAISAGADRPRRPPPKPQDTTRKYCGMTAEQRAWNEAVDAKKKARKS